MASPDVSVIIPTRDRANYLRQAVASVLAQRDASVEVLIVDDGDGVQGFCDSRVRVFDNRRRGPVPARNLGVDETSASLVAFLDDDDWWHDDRHLARALQVISSGADFTFSDGTLKYVDGQADRPFAFDADAASLARDNTILISAVCYRKSLHAALGHFDEALPYYWDWDWYLRVARSGAKLQHVPENTVAIRVHSSNMSGSGAIGTRRANLDAFAAKHSLPHIELKNHESLARDNISNI